MNNTFRTQKTPQNKRANYNYYFCNNEIYILKPGENGVTEELIKYLHSEDDSEVYYNLKNCSIQIKNENYDPDNPNENKKTERIWFESIDYQFDDETSNDKSRVMLEAFFVNSDDEMENLISNLFIKEIVETKCTDKQKQFLRLCDEGYKATEIAVMFGISDAAVTKMKKRIASQLIDLKMFF